MSQTNTAANSLAKIKTLGDLKTLNGGAQQQTQEVKQIQNLMTSMQLNTSQRQSSRFQERKTISCLSQDRVNSAVGGIY